MEFLERIFLSFLQSSLTASAVIVIVILILKIFNSRLRIRVKNALWILVLIKLLIPVVAETNINLFSILYEKYGSVSQAEVENFVEIDKQSQVNEEIYNNFNYTNNSNIVTDENNKMQENNNKSLISGIFKIASCIWLIGLVISSTAILLFTFRLKRKTKGLKKYTNTEILTLIKECRDKLNIKLRIPVYIYDGFKSPCILGIIKPRIYIPKYVLNIKDNNQLSHIFLHELIHYKRKDLIYNFVSIMALSIHWFNPLVWFAIKKMKLYREYACDACVLELLNEEGNTEYGMTILSLSKMLLNKGSYSQVPIFFQTNNQIKDRIWMIKGFRKGSYKITAKAVLGCVIAANVIFTNNLAVKALNAENIIQTSTNNIENFNSVNKSEDDDANNINDNVNGNESNLNAVSASAENNVTSSNGKWVQDNGKWYYYYDDGVMQKDKIITIDGVENKFDETGAWVSNEATSSAKDAIDKMATTDKSNETANKVSGNSNNTVKQDQYIIPQAKTAESSVYEVTNNKSNVDNHVSTDAEKEKDKCWKREGESWVYDEPLADKLTGWVKFSYGNENKPGHHEEWYHFNENGIMDKNTTITEDGKVYEFREDGTLKNVPGP